MTKNEKSRIRIPFSVRIRAYISHTLIALTVLAAYLLLFAFVSEDTAGALSEIKRFEESEHNEIVFASEPNGDATFIYLKNYALCGNTQENALSDVLMTLDYSTYSSDLGFCGTLGEGTCAVSANVSARYGLSIGDTARVMNTDKTFTVSNILPAQSGIDEEYMHEGIVILAYDEELLDRAFTYVSFTRDGDGYRSLDRLVFTDDLIDAAKGTLVLICSVSVLFVAFAVVICELFLFRKRREDYLTLATIGVSRLCLFLRALAEGSIKYFLPSLLTALLFSVRLWCYGRLYLISVSCFSALSLLSSLILAIIYVRRPYRVRAK